MPLRPYHNYSKFIIYLFIQLIFFPIISSFQNVQDFTLIINKTN